MYLHRFFDLPGADPEVWKTGFRWQFDWPPVERIFFLPLEVVVRGSETQLQVGENLYKITFLRKKFGIKRWLFSLLSYYIMSNAHIESTCTFTQILAEQGRLWANGKPTLAKCPFLLGRVWNHNVIYYLIMWTRVQPDPANTDIVPLLGQWGGGPRLVVSTAAFHVRVRGSVPGLGGLKETKNVSSPSTCESQYCGGPPWPRGSVLGLRLPGLEFRIMCLEESVISIISPSSGGFPGPV